MSYLVESLFLDTERIKKTGEVESDEYSDLLTIEACENRLYHSGRITIEENYILNLYKEYRSTKQVMEKVGNSKLTVLESFRRVCNKVAFELGGHFTDEGYLEYMTNKYSLTEQQVQELTSILKNEERHSIRRIR